MCEDKEGRISVEWCLAELLIEMGLNLFPTTKIGYDMEEVFVIEDGSIYFSMTCLNNGKKSSRELAINRKRWCNWQIDLACQYQQDKNGWTRSTIKMLHLAPGVLAAIFAKCFWKTAFMIQRIKIVFEFDFSEWCPALVFVSKIINKGHLRE